MLMNYRLWFTLHLKMQEKYNQYVVGSMSLRVQQNFNSIKTLRWNCHSAAKLVNVRSLNFYIWEK